MTVSPKNGKSFNPENNLITIFEWLSIIAKNFATKARYFTELLPFEKNTFKALEIKPQKVVF